jgi:hypothetical protein
MPLCRDDVFLQLYYTLTALCTPQAGRSRGSFLKPFNEIGFWSLRVLLSPEKEHPHLAIALGNPALFSEREAGSSQTHLFFLNSEQS